MRVERFSDAGAVARRAADIVAEALRADPALVLGLATGETMRPFYADLVARHRRGEISFARATTFNLDEFVGMPASDPGSFAAYMHDLFFDHVDLPPGRAHLPRGDAADPDAEAARYEAAIAAAGGIGLQMLGIGTNGHLAFNEPGAAPTSRTRVTMLEPSTREANAARFPGGATPSRAITMGLGTIFEARELVLLATGAPKAEAVARMVEGPAGPDCPATVLALHPRATVLLDPGAASRLGPRSRAAHG